MFYFGEVLSGLNNFSMGVWLPCKHAGTQISIIRCDRTEERMINNVCSIGIKDFVHEVNFVSEAFFGI
jgi:hypothetical protein